MSKIKVGIITPNDPRPWVRRENTDTLLHFQQLLIDALKQKDVEVVLGGEDLPKDDQVVWNTALVKKHITKILEKQPDAIILNMGDWCWPYDSRDAVQMFANGLKGINKGIARVLFFCYKAPEVPGLVGGMAAAGALRRIGIPYKLVFGKIDEDPTVINKIMAILNMYKRRAEAAPSVSNAIEQIKGTKYISVGGMALKMCTGTADVDQWSKIFGITYDALDQSELTWRAKEMISWTGKPGHSEIVEIKDERVKKALEYQKAHASFDFSRKKLTGYEKFAYQLAYYYAAVDIVKQEGCGFMGIKCQDELSRMECTQCVTAAFLNNNVGPDGVRKETVPVACENDMDSSLTQLILKNLNNGKPAGFGDFRDIENNEIAVVNCGQHPPFFYGKPEEDSIEKLNHIEYLGQEHFYDAGGASVRGRTPGGQVMTFARLYRDNLRYGIVAMAVTTVQPEVAFHKKYSESWPIILGKTAISDQEVIDLWPCNHLGFAYGDLTPNIIEFAERVDIGYTVYDLDGNVYKKFS